LSAASSESTTPRGKPANIRTVAVIDCGTTSIRLAVAEINDAGDIRSLTTLSQAVNLGKDAFRKGAIDKATIEECVRILKSYRRVMREYQIGDSTNVRIVATSAVREASNHLAFVDRIYIATGMEVDVLDESEVNRITYLGVQPLLQSPAMAGKRAVVVEVGGGSTELLLVREGDVVFSNSYRLGSLRLRQILEGYRASALRLRTIMESQIKRFVDQVARQIGQLGECEMVSLGGDMRFAASQLLPEWSSRELSAVPVSELAKLVERLLGMSDEELAHKYKVDFQDAETLGPALLAYLRLAQTLKQEQIWVSNVSLRDGLLHELALREAWTEEFSNQVTRSAVDLGRRYNFDENHALHVAALSKTLFQSLRDEHRLDGRYEVILYLAALLHEIGLFISHRSYHKHTMYLIRNSEIFGLGKRELLLVSLVARYHRRASPQPLHEGYSTLDRERRVAVAKMAAMLRVAIALDESRSQRITEIRYSREDGRLVIGVPNVDDLSLEQLALRANGALFDETFGMQTMLRRIRS
jgi:exopolyphosphatase / guanosine-5'-triphosphate,3'-diphosphate pyrophosphatase